MARSRSPPFRPIQQLDEPLTVLNEGLTTLIEGDEPEANPSNPPLLAANGQSLRFYLHSSLQHRPQRVRETTAELIRESGGVIVEQEDDADIVIADDFSTVYQPLVRHYEEHVPDTHVECPDWLLNCVRTQRVIYSRFQKHTMGGRHVGETITYFSPCDKQHLTYYLAHRSPCLLTLQKPDYEQANVEPPSRYNKANRAGKKLYQQLCDSPRPWASNHPWQAWRNQYCHNQRQYDEWIDAYVDIRPNLRDEWANRAIFDYEDEPGCAEGNLSQAEHAQTTFLRFESQTYDGPRWPPARVLRPEELHNNGATSSNGSHEEFSGNQLGVIDQTALRSTPMIDSYEEASNQSLPANITLSRAPVLIRRSPSLRLLREGDARDQLDAELEEEPEDPEKEEQEQGDLDYEGVTSSAPPAAVHESLVASKQMGRTDLATGEISQRLTIDVRNNSMPPPSKVRNPNKSASAAPGSFVRRLMLLQQARHAPPKRIWRTPVSPRRFNDFEVPHEGEHTSNKRRRLDPLADRSNISSASEPTSDVPRTTQGYIPPRTLSKRPVNLSGNSGSANEAMESVVASREDVDPTNKSLLSDLSPALPPKRALPHFDTPGESIPDLLALANAAPTTPYDGRSSLRIQRRPFRSVDSRRISQTARSTRARTPVADNRVLPSWAKAVQPRSDKVKGERGHQPSHLTTLLGSTSALIPHIDFNLPQRVAVSMIRRDMDGSPIRDGNEARQAASRRSLASELSPRRLSQAPSEARTSQGFDFRFASDSFGSPMVRTSARPKTPRSSLLSRPNRHSDPFVEQ